MAPPRVLATTDAVGGVWTYAIDLAVGFSAHGIATTLAVLGPSPNRAQIEYARSVPGLVMVDTGLSLDWMAESAEDLLASKARLRELANASGAALVHLNSPSLAVGQPFQVPVVGVVHSCLATWWDAVRGGPLPEDFAWRARLLQEGMLACDALIAPTAAFGHAVARRYNVALPAVVHNGRDSSALHRSAKQRRAITVGRLWDPGKNVMVLDEAASRLTAPLVAVGPLAGPNGEQVMLRHARCTGSLDATAVASALSEARVFASAARYEPFGLAVLEAAQAGCALVLSDIPTFRELWHAAARFVPADDVAGFTHAIQSLLDDLEESDRLAAAARRRAEALTSTAMARGVLEVYRTLIPGFAASVARGAAA
jgi:glycogen(starch) synthase